MKREHIVEFVGGQEEEIAYLRLSLRKAARQLLETWRLRREDDSHVDLLVIYDAGDPGSAPLAGEIAQRRVRLIDPAFGAAGMETAPWPLALETLIRLLNLSSAGIDIPAATAAPVIQHNIYDELFEPAPAQRWLTGDHDLAHLPNLDFNDTWQPPPLPAESALMLEAENLFRREVEPGSRDAFKSIRLQNRVQPQSHDANTSGSAAAADRQELAGTQADARYKLGPQEAEQRHPLASYLGDRLLPGPARIEACHVVLTLDPRNRQYYATGSLRTFEDCCREALRRGDWQSVSFTEIAELKMRLKPRPYAELQWLCAYLDANAATAEFAATTRYRLIQQIELADDYPRAAWIARELAQRCTLEVAAAAAGAPLAEAQRVAAAFDTLGFLIPD